MNDYLIFDNLIDAEEVVSRFEENDTIVELSSDGLLFGVFIVTINKHKLTQIEREAMVDLPNNFHYLGGYD